MEDPHPLIIAPPPGGNEYFEILGNASAVKMRSGMVTLMPGKDVGLHSTENYEELIIVLSGEGEIETNANGRKKVKAGELAYNPPNTRHNVFNSGKAPMRYIYVVSEAK